MGRALLIICAGLLVALGYTFLGLASSRESMTLRNVNTYHEVRAKNTANSGIQIAIQKYNNDKEEFSDFNKSYDGADLTLTVNEILADSIIKVISESDFNGAEHTVTSTFDISKKQQLVPDYAGALTQVGNQNINFEKGNPKVHFEGNAPSGSPCSDKPGLTVEDPNEVDEYGGSSNIDGSPPVAQDNSIKVDDISDLIDRLEDKATSIDSGFNWQTSTSQNPGVYFVNGNAHYSGKDNGYGILVVRNNATLNIDDNELTVTGQFTFNGLIIFEDGSDFTGAGKAQFNGTVLSASQENTTFNIKANGNFTAQYDCEAKEYADAAVNASLNTIKYKQLSIYE